VESGKIHIIMIAEEWGRQHPGVNKLQVDHESTGGTNADKTRYQTPNSENLNRLVLSVPPKAVSTQHPNSHAKSLSVESEG
jgi:hypothetical protein